MMIVDSHVHIFPEEIIGQLPKGFDVMYQAFKREPSPGLSPLEEFIKDMDKAGVDKAVLLPIDAETTWNYKIPNEYIAKTVQRFPDRFVGFASVDPNKGRKGVSELEEAIKSLQLKGLKLVPYLQEFYPNDKKVYPLYEKAVELDIPILTHTGQTYGFPIKHCNPIYLDDVACDFPDLKIIAAHGGWPWVDELLAVATKHNNVYMDLSGWHPKYLPKELLRYANSLLRERTLFGTDYPLLLPSVVLPALKPLLRDKAKPKILGENAAELLSLKK